MEHQHHHHHHHERDQNLSAVITSGEDTTDDEYSDGFDNRGHQDDRAEVEHDNGKDDLYDENADEQDEEYVLKYMRLGGTQSNTSNAEQASSSVTKPPNSDAVLCCPCCFNIVCLDCQRHERFSNQYRAMFVMGIIVRWDQQLLYDDATQSLVEASHAQQHHDGNTVDRVPPDETTHHYNDNNSVYYTVRCANCLTQVAALDMTDEVYHFFGCLASS